MNVPEFWPRPNYTPAKLWWKFLISGFFYLVLGIALVIHYTMVQEIEIDYTDCERGANCTRTINLEKEK